MKRKRLPLPPAERLRELLSYDQHSGILTWRVQRPGGRSGVGCKAGSIAGMRKQRGHIEIRVDGVRYQAHRIAWKIMTGLDPIDQIDHRNCDPGDNSWANLREANQRQNSANRRCDPRGAVGLKGVTRARGRRGKLTGKWK